MTMFGYSISYAQAGDKSGPLDQIQYALLPAFYDGVLDSCADGFRFIDGHEGGYYISETQEYFRSYNYMKVRSAAVVAPELRDKYALCAEAGHAVAVDYCYNGWWDTAIASFPLEYRQKWFEHNIYHALLSSDSYVWLYSELGSRAEESYDDPMNWWTNPPKYIPEGFEEAIVAAKQKLAIGEALGYDMVKNGDGYWDGTVQAELAAAPSITISSPKWNDTLEPGSSADIAVATPVTGISKIELYCNSVKTAEKSTSPFTFQIQKPEMDDYTLVARAYTSDNKHVTSNPVTFTVGEKGAAVVSNRKLTEPIAMLASPAATGRVNTLGQCIGGNSPAAAKGVYISVSTRKVIPRFEKVRSQ
jgi:hypothetical protein